MTRRPPRSALFPYPPLSGSAMTAHASAAGGGAEPQQTAAAVRELIEAMRARLESAVEERTRLAGELEEVRGPRSEEHTSELHQIISYAVFCLKTKKQPPETQ